MCGVRLLSLHHPMKLSKASSKRLWIDLPGNSFIRAIASKPPAARSAPAPRLKQCNISGRAMEGDCAPGINRRGEIALPRLNGSGGSSDQDRSWQWAGLMSHHSWASVWAGQGSQIEDNPGRWIKLRDLGRNKKYVRSLGTWEGHRWHTRRHRGPVARWKHFLNQGQSPFTPVNPTYMRRSTPPTWAWQFYRIIS